jgi:hypothetical protein
MACEHKEGCIAAMGCRLNKVPLSQAKFNLVPTALQSVHDVPTREDTTALFYASHEAVFGKPCAYRIPNAGVRKIEAAAAEANCGLRLFMTAVMMAHQEANPQNPFFPTMLFGQSAIRRVNMYRTICHEKYGHFDIGAFDLLRGKVGTVDDLATRMLRSEVLFGELVVGYKLRSDTSPFAHIYRLRERGFDPVWLAIEDTYVDVLERHLNSDDPVTGTVATLRHNVAQVQKSLKRNKARLATVLKTREQCMPQAITQVMTYHRLNPADFEIADEPVTVASKFWSVLGTAVGHYYCWLALNGDKYAMSKISTK